MRTPSALITGAATAAIVAIGWNVGQAALTADITATTNTAAGATDSGNATTNSSGSAASSAGSSAGASESSGSEASTATTTAADGTYVGDTVQTRYGPMQVQVVISGGAITAVDTLQYPANDGKSVEINQQAIPILLAEVLQIQSADLTNISRATYTSQSYKNSLQSALDAAGFTG